MSEVENNMSAEEVVRPTWHGRLKDPRCWREPLVDTAIWIMVATLVIHMLKLYAPGYPIAVSSPSIEMGVYWRDRTVTSYSRGEVASFAFEPMPAQVWLRERYWRNGLVHTKRIIGLAGDTVKVDPAGRVTVCTLPANTVTCTVRGDIRKVDSKGRPMHSWVPLGGSYTLQAGEAWMMGEHPFSLDSRYQGPVQLSQLLGRAKLLWSWGH